MESKKTLIYITRDVERALGPQTGAALLIIANSTPFAKQVAKGQGDIVLIEAAELLDTPELLQHPTTKACLDAHPEAGVVVFKNVPLIEKTCATNGWKLLNPAAALANRVEEKVSQVEWLGDLAKYLPPHHVQLLKDVAFDGAPFIVQFNRAHTGNGTILINNATKLQELQAQFPDRPVRVTEFVDGHMFTSNNIVSDNTVITGNISYQITGLAPFTDSPFVTIGNDWALGKQWLSGALFKEYDRMVADIGTKLDSEGWRGLFGVDVMVDAKKEKLYLIEINARQPASTTYESQLQTMVEPDQDFFYTIFDGHLRALQGESLYPMEMIEINDGAQIILRNQTNLDLSDDRLQPIIKTLQTLGFNCITYPNTEPGSDRLRIQSATSMFRAPGKYNEVGKAIADCLNQALA